MRTASEAGHEHDDEAAGDARRGRVVTVFRSRLRPEARAEYHDTAQRMLELARGMPGFVDFKTFESDDGERVSLITFASSEEHRAWRDHPEHRAAQRLGRERLYASYTVTVCSVTSERRFSG